MANRGRRRRVVESNDSDSGDAQPMSPNTQRRHDQEIIMKHDLGTATADFIKTSDYKRPQASHIDLVRKCDIPGTQEAKLAEENKEKAKGWQAYGQTDEAKQAATGDVTQGKGNVHRRATRQKLEEAAKPLGHKLDLEDTYDDHKFRRPFPMAKDTSQPARRHQGRQQHAAPKKPSMTVPSPAKKKGQKRTQPDQNRSGPPPAPAATPALPNLPKLSNKKKGTPTARSASISKVSSAPATPSPAGVTGTISTSAAPASTRHKGGITPAAAPLQPTLADPKTFMSSVNEFLSKPKSAERGRTKDRQSTNGATIQEVSFGKCSSPVNGKLGPDQESAPTDSAPRPGEISGISASAEVHLPVSKEEDSNQAEDLIGLGIEGLVFNNDLLTVENPAHLTSATGSSPHHGSLLDSPVPDNIGSGVLVADTYKTEVIDGVRYVPEKEMLAWKNKFEDLLKQSDSTARISPEPVASFTESAKEPDANDPLTANANTLSIESNTAVKVNPFSPREPVLPPTGVDTAVQSGTALQFFSGSLDEAMVVAVRPGNASRPLSSITPAATSTPTLVDVTSSSVKSETAASKLAALNPRAIFATPSAKQPASELSTLPVSTLEATAKVPAAYGQPAGISIPRSGGSFFGDRKARGKVPQHAKEIQPAIPAWLTGSLKEQNIKDPLACFAIPGHQVSSHSQKQNSPITAAAEQSAAEDTEESEL